MYKKAAGEKMQTIGRCGPQRAGMICLMLCCAIIFTATAVFAAFPESSSIIPDTGQSACYDTTTNAVLTDCTGSGQDGAYDSQTLPFASYYTGNPDGTITDNVTLFNWQLDDGVTYNWFEASGTVDGTYNPDPGHLDVCGSLGAGWRLPTIKELNQILHYGTSDPAIDPTFLGLSGNDYWSATVSGLVPSSAMNVHFDSATVTRVDGRDKASEANYVMCVSGSELTMPDDSRFVDHGTTVSDNMIGLMWQQTDDNAPRTWAAALAYCEAYAEQGYLNWRLPNIKELQTIVDYDFSNPAISTTFFPGTNSVGYWSSTTDDAYSDSAWSLNFSDGSAVSVGKTLGTLYTRCVRDNDVDITGPVTALTSHPTDPSYSSSASFSFTSEAGAIFQCKLDSGTYSACSSPKSYTGLSATSHTFYVRAKDAALNFGTAVTFSWTVSLDPDFTVTTLTVPATGGAGSAINVTDMTKNIGVNAGGASTTGFYLSNDSVWDVSDVSLGGRTVPSLGAGVTNSATTSVSIPADTLAGAYYIIAKADAPELLPETNETNNTKVSSVITIGPDLTVSALTVPSSAKEGATITVTNTTKNNGSFLGTSVTSFYLSKDTTLTVCTSPGVPAGCDPEIGATAVDALPVGGTYQVATSITLPRPLAAASYYIIAKADGPNVITETNEANNTRTSSVIKIGGDLTVSALTVPATALPGGTIDVQVTTQNSANGSGVYGSLTRFYLSKDTTLTACTSPGVPVGCDPVIGTRTVPALAGSGTDQATVTLTMPANAGIFYILAVADASNNNTELNETNNTKASVVIKVGGDLTVYALTAPATGTPGGPIDVTDTTKNSATGSDVGTSTTRFYLSKDTTLTVCTSPGVPAGCDPALGSRSVPVLGIGLSDTATTTLTIPAGKAGSFYIIAKADADNVLTETNETNNTRVSLAIKIGGDLTVSALTAPATGVAGSGIAVTDTTKNGTTGTAVGESTTGFYLSTKTVLDGSTEVLIGSRLIAALAVGGASTATTNLTIPSATPAGSYYIIAKADAPGLIDESSETNNTKVSTVIKIGGDLTVTALTVPATGLAGAAASANYTLKNIGTAEVAASTTKFWLSPDNILTPGANGDVVLGSRPAAVLAAGASLSATTSLTIPAGTTPGTYYIIAKADGPGLIAEVSETNNIKVSAAIKIGPDLVVSVLTAPSTVTAGVAFNVSETTKNTGAARAIASTTSFYLSTNNTLDGGDVLLGSRDVVALAAGVSNSATTSLTILAGTTPGTYYIIGKADSGNVVTEANENNNTVVKMVTVP